MIIPRQRPKQHNIFSGPLCNAPDPHSMPSRANTLPAGGRTGPDQARPSQTSPKYIIFSQNIESTIVYNPG